jgi:hypothetical protein
MHAFGWFIFDELFDRFSERLRERAWRWACQLSRTLMRVFAWATRFWSTRFA